MTPNIWNATASRVALALPFAVGLAVAPFGTGEHAAISNTAAAQAVEDPGRSEVDGAAEEFVQDPTPDFGGSGSPGVSSGEKPMDYTTLNTTSDEFRRYSEAAERNDLSAAGYALYRARAGRDVTPDLVEHVNEELDVRTSLAPEQIAEAANKTLPY
jgi:hypothetical protein